MYSSRGTCGKPYFRTLDYFVYTIWDKRKGESPYSFPRILSLLQRTSSGSPSRGKRGKRKASNMQLLLLRSSESNLRPEKTRNSKNSTSDELSSKMAETKRKVKVAGVRREGYLEKWEKKWTTQNPAKMRQLSKTILKTPNSPTSKTILSLHVNGREIPSLKIVRLDENSHWKPWNYKYKFPMMLSITLCQNILANLSKRGKLLYNLPPKNKIRAHLKTKTWPSLCDFCWKHFAFVCLLFWMTKYLIFNKNPKMNIS